MLPDVIIYTDGSCSNKLRMGGYCALMCCGNHSMLVYDHFRNTTNNQMELSAIIQAFKTLSCPCNVNVISDSQYALGGIGKFWIYGWMKRGWITSTGQPVANKELWIELFELCKPHIITWTWCKGHSGVLGNEICDVVSRAYPDSFFVKK